MRAFFLIGCLMITGLARAGDPPPGPGTRAFDLPAGPAEFTLKGFSSQSGVDVVFETKTVSGIQTQAVKGRYLPIEAVALMLRGTPLTAAQSARGAAVVISPAAEPPAAPARH